MPIEPQTLEKTPDEIRTFEFDWSAFPEFQGTGTTIVSVLSKTATPAGPSLGGATISGAKVQIPITGGTEGQYHLLEVQILLSEGTKLAGFGYLAIVKPIVPPTP